MTQPASFKRVVAIRGSKGGVGASMIATNLGIFLAQIGKRVLLVDADVNNGALHTWLGMTAPEKSIGDVLVRDASIPESAVATPITGLYLLATVTHLQGSDYLTRVQMEQLWHQLEQADADFVIIDLPNNIDDFTVSLFCRADSAVLVSLPLPDSVEATYRFMMAAWLHQLTAAGVGRHETVEQFLREVKTASGKPKTPREVIAQLAQIHPDAAEAAMKLSTEFHPQLIVNQIKLKDDEDLGDSIVSASTRWLGVVPILLGSIGWDDNVWLAQRRGKRLLTDFARSRACKDLEQIVRKMMSREYQEQLLPTVIPPETIRQNYYELLEIFPGASEEEVRRAYKQIQHWFGLEGMSVRGAASEEERLQFERLAETAHARLLDRSERREYDKQNFPDGFHRAAPPELKQRDSIAGTVNVTQASLPTVTLSDDDFVDGIFLGKIRRACNVELEDISNRAKISVRYLRAIEEERFNDLPASVFTRGFVTEFARFLKIDPKRATTDFMSKFEKSTAAKR